MEKTCLVLMPTSDPDGYAQGHFNRVYEYIISPACRTANFSPAMVTEVLAASGEVFDLIKILVEGDLVICDLTSQNENVAYGFAIRKVLNLPVVLVQDLKTQAKVTDEFEALTYDESLRIDTVQSEVQALTDTITKTYAAKGEDHPILKAVGQRSTTSTADQPKETSKEKSLPIISPLPDYVGSPFTKTEIEKLKVGDALFHLSRGRGEITSLKKTGHEILAGIKFESGAAILVLANTDYFRKIEE